MKKIGILNYQYSNHNYGAVLQAAALHDYIENELGISSEHINYIPGSESGDGKEILRSVVLKLLMIVGLKKKKILHHLVLNSDAFERFRKSWLPRTTKIYTCPSDLKNEQFSYSHVVVGSDQVWRPSYAGIGALTYFFDFIPSDIKRISYAASFGNDSWELNENDTHDFSKEVNKFSAVSVREKSAVAICKEQFGVDAKHALDPTLLVGREFFEKIIKQNEEKIFDGVVTYKLDVDAEFTSFVDSASSRLGVSSKNIYLEKRMGLDRYHDVGDWLSYIKNSRFVVTDSFHCVCFAILFERPFVFYPNNNRGLSRLESLLSELDLESLIYRAGMMESELLKRAVDIDYADVKAKLGRLRCQSSEFLRHALGE